MKPVRKSGSPRVICPPLGLTRPAIALSSVDLPQPDGPSSDTNSPRRTVRLSLSTATTLPKRTSRFSIERTGFDGTSGAPSNRSVKTIAFITSVGRHRLRGEGLGDVDCLFLEAGGEQKLLCGAPAGFVHVADRLVVGRKQRQARLHHCQFMVVSEFVAVFDRDLGRLFRRGNRNVPAFQRRRDKLFD